MNRISQTIPLQNDTIFSPYHATEFPRSLEDIRANGFTGVELAIANPQTVNILQLKQYVHNAGLTVTTISTGQAYDLYGACLSSPEYAARQKAISLIQGHLELAAELGGCPVTIGLLRGKHEKGDKKELLKIFADSMEQCLKSEGKQSILQIEPINRKETCLLNNTKEVLDLIQELSAPDQVGILYDTYHSYLEEPDMLEAIRAAGCRITNVHLADSTRGLPGSGCIPFQDICRLLIESGYHGAFALETLAIPTEEECRSSGYPAVMAILP